MVSINASTVGELGDEENKREREPNGGEGRELNTWMTTRDFWGTGGFR